MQCDIFYLKIINFVNVFSQFWYHFHLEKNVALYGTLNFVHVFSLMRYYLPFQKGVALQSRFGLKFCLKWSNGFGEYLKMFVNVFPLFRFYLRLGKAWPFIWINLNLYPRNFVQSWLKLVPWFWEVKDVQKDRQTDERTERQTDGSADGLIDRRWRQEFRIEKRKWDSHTGLSITFVFSSYRPTDANALYDESREFFTICILWRGDRWWMSTN